MGKSGYWIAGFCLFWLAVVVSLYYVYHKPVDAELVSHLIKTFWSLVTAFAWATAAAASGQALMPLGEHPSPVRPVLQAGLGFGAIGIGWLIVGSTLGFRVPIAALYLFILLAFFHRRLPLIAQDLVGFSTLWKASRLDGRFLAALAAIICFATLAMAMAPPIKFDALVYHLTLPQRYIQAGGMIYMPDLAFWGMPQIGEMLYTGATLLGGLPAAAILGWLFGVLALGGIFAWLSDRLSPSAGWAGVAALLSGFTLADSLAWAYVDWLAILFGFCVLAVIEQYGTEATGLHSNKTLIFAGIFAGFALGTKYTAGVILLGGGFSLAWGSWMRGEQRQIGRLLLIFGLSALAASSPWWIKNALATGNPLYPFLLPSGAMDSLRQHFYQGGKAWGNWLDVFLLPIRATVIGAEAAPGYSASIGPLLLGLSPAAWLAWKNSDPAYRRLVSLAVSMAMPGVLVWMLLGRFSAYLLQSRLYFVLFPALAALAGAGWRQISQVSIGPVRFRRLAGALVIMVMGLTTIEVGGHVIRAGAISYLVGEMPPAEYLSGNLGWYAPAVQKVHALPQGSKVLMLWEPRSLYCTPACSPDELLDRWLRDWSAEQDGDRVLGRWREAGLTHLLYNHLGADFLRSQDPRYAPVEWEELDLLISRLDLVAEFGSDYALYQLPP